MYDEQDLRNIRIEFESKAHKLASALIEGQEVLTFDEMTDIALSMEQMTETVDDLLVTVAAAEATRR